MTKQKPTYTFDIDGHTVVEGDEKKENTHNENLCPNYASVLFLLAVVISFFVGVFVTLLLNGGVCV